MKYKLINTQLGNNATKDDIPSKPYHMVQVQGVAEIKGLADLVCNYITTIQYLYMVRAQPLYQ